MSVLKEEGSRRVVTVRFEAKLLASEAAWNAAEAAMATFGGLAFAQEVDVERKWREARLYRTAPVSTNLVLAYVGQHVLGLPKSY